MKAYLLMAVCAILSSACAGGLLVGMMVSARLFGFSCAHEPQWFKNTMQHLSTGLFYSALLGVLSLILITLRN
ncbi:hypothetical protein [uncultured Alteromonas sp.]|jgi:hypothetical protein|uniref:hypothetical protein n=1 Tax=uncultured Alteromonas sp. TaxID=179113 RepID=UPI002587A8B3|nr:hypothetical protein [uncultured Alteromonas sp.]